MDERTTRRCVIGLQHSRRASVLFLVAFLGYLALPVSWLAVSVVAAVAAAIAQVKAFRAFSVVERSGGLRTMSVLAIVASSLLAVLAIVPIAAELRAPARRDCFKGANTAHARAACADRYGPMPSRQGMLP